MFKVLGGVIGTALGMVASEAIGKAAWNVVPGGEAAKAIGLPVALGAAGYFIGGKGGLIGSVGRGAMVGSALHLAGLVLKPDHPMVNFGAY